MLLLWHAFKIKANILARIDIQVAIQIQVAQEQIASQKSQAAK